MRQFDRHLKRDWKEPFVRHDVQKDPLDKIEGLMSLYRRQLASE